ncbi:hypothetical protein [Parabacteroides johnsonii]|jgi:hypothetical protein|uniref:hypothetical protein n=1 Tax=Parabacteroides johnsonii TaxID=387661 RepID=UPI0011DE2952|nr:hypothetical protein [Parabacteroides johnsonii]
MSNNCNCNKIQPAVITPVLALGSVASPYFVQVQVAQRLCYPTCVENTPVFNPRFSVKSVAQVAATQYVATIHVEGVISYVKCHGGCDCSKQQPLSQDFTVPISKTGTAPVVSLTQGASVNAMASVGCQTCGRNFLSETPITITVA